MRPRDESIRLMRNTGIKWERRQDNARTTYIDSKWCRLVAAPAALPTTVGLRRHLARSSPSSSSSRAAPAQVRALQPPEFGTDGPSRTPGARAERRRPARKTEATRVCVSGAARRAHDAVLDRGGRHAALRRERNRRRCVCRAATEGLTRIWRDRTPLSVRKI